jgi:hypothetical protein
VDPYLEQMVGYTGAVVALVASFLAAPAATRHLWETGPKRWAITTAVQGRAATAKVKRTFDMARGDVDTSADPARQVVLSNRKALVTTTSLPVRNHTRAPRWPIA